MRLQPHKILTCKVPTKHNTQSTIIPQPNLANVIKNVVISVTAKFLIISGSYNDI